MATEKALRAAAKEMQDVMGLEPPINVKAPIADLTEQLKEAIEQIQEGDEFSKTTQAIIDEFNAPEEEEEVVTPKRKKATDSTPTPKKKAPVVEEDDEEEDEEEEPEEEPEEEIVVPKKGTKKPVKKVVEEDEDEEDEDEPEEEVVVPKKGTKSAPAKTEGAVKKSPFVAASVHRAETYSMALAKNPKTLKQWAELANDIYVKNGGRDSMKQAEFDVQWLVKLFKHLDIAIPTK